MIIGPQENALSEGVARKVHSCELFTSFRINAIIIGPQENALSEGLARKVHSCELFGKAIIIELQENAPCPWFICIKNKLYIEIARSNGRDLTLLGKDKEIEG